MNPPVTDHRVLGPIFRAVRRMPGVFKATRESECVEFSAFSRHTGRMQRYEVVVREIDGETEEEGEGVKADV